MAFAIHWHESAMGLHVFPIPIPPPTSLSTRSLWVFPVHQPRALVLCIQPGLVICFTLDNIHVSMLFSWNIPPRLRHCWHLGQKRGLQCLKGLCAQSFSHVWLFAAPWTVAHQTPLPMALSRRECWRGLPFPSPGDLPDPGIKPMSPMYPALAGRFCTSEPPGSPGVSHPQSQLLWPPHVTPSRLLVVRAG